MFTSAGLVLLTAVSVNAQLAGNENYAWEARQSLNVAHKRDNELSFSPSSTSFSIGGKDYLSPTGSQFRQYILNSTWGLDGYGGTVLPVTVFEVEGEVTCSVLGDKVKEYGAVDDVWEQVSRVFQLQTEDRGSCPRQSLPPSLPSTSLRMSQGV
jgi:hypothetical protein